MLSLQVIQWVKAFTKTDEVVAATIRIFLFTEETAFGFGDKTKCFYHHTLTTSPNRLPSIKTLHTVTKKLKRC